MINPCYGCEAENGRSFNCHADCNKYKNWKKEDLIKKEKINKEKEKSQFHFDSLARAIGKNNVSSIGVSSRKRWGIA